VDTFWSAGKREVLAGPVIGFWNAVEQDEGDARTLLAQASLEGARACECTRDRGGLPALLPSAGDKFLEAVL
jgi:hypothetical protein